MSVGISRHRLRVSGALLALLRFRGEGTRGCIPTRACQERWRGCGFGPRRMVGQKFLSERPCETSRGRARPWVWPETCKLINLRLPGCNAGGRPAQFVDEGRAGALGMLCSE